MGGRAQVLASRFQGANDELIAFAQQLSEEQWKTPCISDGRTIGVVLYHVAEGHALTSEVVRSLAIGLPLPLDLVQNREEADLRNARQAKEHGNCTKDETVELLRRHGQAVVELVGSLADEELACAGVVWGQEADVGQLIDYVLIGHLIGHLGAVRATAEGKHGTR